MENVAGIQKETVISMAEVDPFVHRIVNSLVWFADRDRVWPRDAAGEFRSAVGGGAVDNDPFEFLVRLSQDRLRSFLKTGQIIPVYGYDGK